MRYLCEGCNQLVVAAAVAARDGAPALVCPTCGAATRMGEAPAAAPLPPATPPAPAQAPLATVQPLPRPSPSGPLCPKCAAARAQESESCARCGLVFALFDPAQFALSPPLEELWAKARQSRRDAAPHVAFLESCGRAAVLAEAARRYRLWAEEEPSHALARQFRDQAVSQLLAASQLPARDPAEAAETARRRKRLKLMLAGAFAGVALGLVVFLFLAWRP